MTNWAVERIHRIAQQQKQPWIPRGTLIESTNTPEIGLLGTENGFSEDENSSESDDPNEGAEEEILVDSLPEPDAERDDLSDEESPSNPIDTRDEVSPVSNTRDQEHRGSEPTLCE